MRWLTRSTLIALAIGLVSHVESACTGGPSLVQEPDANALTLFVTSVATGTMNGNFPNFAPGPGGATNGDTNGLTAADHICTYYATNPGALNLAFNFNAPGNPNTPYFNQDVNGNTVQFRALLSTDSVDAIDRFSDLADVNIIDSTSDQNCLASNIADLLGNNFGYSVSHIFDESGRTIASGTQVWTGTGVTDATIATADKPGGRFHVKNQAVSTSTGFCYNSGAWRSSSSGNNGAVGVLYDNGNLAGAPNRWIYDDLTGSGSGLLTCNTGIRLYCLSAQRFNPAPPGGTGDPQFVGLQGQSFQVHGMPDEFFNLITTPTFQLNSRFTYLASGTCNYNNTECWSHPGTYVDQIGFMFPGIHIKVVAGPHHKGLRTWVNGDEMHSHNKLRLTSTGAANSTVSITVSHPHHDVLVVSSPLFTVELTNSDWFFNFNLQFHVPEILSAGKFMHYISDSRPNHGAVDTRYPAYPMHGLIGQTWKNARYPAKRMYQGEVDDYMLMDHQLFSSQFGFNLYQY